MRPKLFASLSGAVLVLSGTAVATAEPAGLDWAPCASVAAEWDPADQRTECAMLTVPLDYRKPGGRTIEVAVSKLPATGERTGSIVVNPGGPGQQGVTMPGHLAESEAAGLNEHHDLIGFDPRGVGYSTALDCAPDETEPDPALSEKGKARFTAERDGARNRQCHDRDPAFVRSLTTPNIARDVDRIREALGEEKIGYYGISWGTALGAQYRTLFDARVDKMLLDSVMPPELSVTAMDDGQANAGENTFHEFAAWIARYDSVYHFGTTQTAVAEALLTLREEHGDAVNSMYANPRKEWAGLAAQLASIRDGGEVPPPPGAPAFGWDAGLTGFNPFQQTALLCNESPSPRDFDAVWRHREERIERFPVAGKFGSYEQRCVGWPVEATPWEFNGGTSPVQLVGHRYEPVTPIGWAIAMRSHIGGDLMTIEDDVHGSLSSLPCAKAAVTFFGTGRTTTETCAGAPVPGP